MSADLLVIVVAGVLLLAALYAALIHAARLH